MSYFTSTTHNMLYIVLFGVPYIATIFEVLTKKLLLLSNDLPILSHRHATTIRVISSRLKYYYVLF